MQTELNMRYFVDAKPGIVLRTQPDVENINYWDGNNPPPRLKGRMGFHKITGKVVITPFKKDYYYCGSWHYILPNKKWCGKKLDKGVEIYTLRFTLNRHTRTFKTERWCKECWEANREFLMKLRSDQELYDQQQEQAEWQLLQSLQGYDNPSARTMAGRYGLDDEQATRRRKLTNTFNVYKGRAIKFIDYMTINFDEKHIKSLNTCYMKLADIIYTVDKELGGAPSEWVTFKEWVENELTQYTDTGDNGEA